MPHNMIGLPLLMSSGQVFTDYSSLAIQALILLILLIILSRAGQIRDLLKKASNITDASVPDLLANDTALGVMQSDDLSEEELVVVLTAAIQAYEADRIATIAPSSVDHIDSDSSYSQQSETVPLIETTAGFRIKSIRRVS